MFLWERRFYESEKKRVFLERNCQPKVERELIGSIDKKRKKEKILPNRGVVQSKERPTSPHHKRGKV